MPTMPGLGLAWRGEGSECARVWGKVLHPQPLRGSLRHVFTPTAI